MLIQLGPFQFQISTAAYSALTRTTQAIWARLPVLAAHERLQAVGNANDTLILVGTVYPEHAVQHGGAKGTITIDTLRDMLKALIPYRITAADGSTWGFWAIEALVNQDSRWIPEGTPRKQQFRLQLRYYGNSYPVGSNQTDQEANSSDTIKQDLEAENTKLSNINPTLESRNTALEGLNSRLTNATNQLADDSP